MDPAAEQTGTHGCFRAVQDTEQAAFMATLAQRAGEFQVAAGGGIETHMISQAVGGQRPEVSQVGELVVL